MSSVFSTCSDLTSDVLVIGAGPAGSSAALHAASLGAKVILVDRHRTGGACTNTGCVPTRVLAIAARLVRDIRRASDYGIVVSSPTIEWQRVIARVRDVVLHIDNTNRIVQSVTDLGGTVLLEGTATFLSANQVRLANTGRVITADRIILCPGGEARRPLIPGVDHALTPQQLLESDTLPESVVIIGSGYTGVQMTTILTAFGSKVHLLDMAPEILPGADHDVSRTLRDSFESQGTHVYTGIDCVDSIELLDSNLKRLTFTHNGTTHSVEVAAVLLCVGWSAAIDGLGLKEAGVQTNLGYITSNDYLQTSVPHIFVAGDADGRDMLVQGADFEGRTAAENAVVGVKYDRAADPMQPYHRQSLPGGGFTDPDHAGVGLTEAQALIDTPDCLVAMIRYTDLDRAIIDNRTAGFLKMICSSDGATLLGAHAAGENAVELIQAVALAMKAGATMAQLASTRLSYPTYSQIIGDTARSLAQQCSARLMKMLESPL